MINPEMQKMFEDGDYKLLFEYIDSLESPNIEKQIEGLVYKSRMMSMIDRWEDGLTLANQAIELSSDNQQEILEIHSLIAKGYGCGRSKHGMLNSTLSQIEIILESTKISIPNKELNKIQGDVHFLKAWYLFTGVQTESSREEFEKSLKIRRFDNDKHALIEVLLHYGFSYLESSRTPELSLQYSKEAVELAEKIGNKHLMGFGYNWYGSAVAYHKDAHEGLEFYDKAISIYEELGEMGKGKLRRIYNNASITYRNLENYDKALEYLKLNLSLAEKSGDLSSIEFAHSNFSFIYVELNDFEKAIRHRKKSLEIAYQINNEGVIANSHSFLGSIYFWKGELNLAEKEGLLVEKISIKLGSVEGIAWSRMWLMLVYTLKMQTDKAFHKIDEILTAVENLKMDQLKGWVYLAAGINHRALGDFEQAQINFDKTGTYFDRIPDVGNIGKVARFSYLILHKILLMLELNDNVKAEEYFEELKGITLNIKSKFIIQRVKFLEGAILKVKTRGSAKFKAQEIFLEIVNSPMTDLNIYSLSLLNLCDLLILEMKITEDPETILKEVITLVNKMAHIGKSQDIPMLLVMGDLINGKIDLVYNDLESARFHFQRAIDLGQENNLNTLISKVQIEQDFVENQISKWKDQPYKDLSLIERVEKAEIQEYLSHAISVKEKMVNSGSIVN